MLGDGEDLDDVFAAPGLGIAASLAELSLVGVMAAGAPPVDDVLATIDVGVAVSFVELSLVAETALVGVGITIEAMGLPTSKHPVPNWSMLDWRATRRSGVNAEGDSLSKHTMQA